MSEQEFREMVGRNIVRAREAIGLTQAELAAAIAIDRRQVSRWERGRVEPSHASLQRVADLTGQPFGYFYTEA
jgi:transcriptional regulator with XRE-family HTH domain